MKLKRELRKLKSENQTLKQQLGGPSPVMVTNSATRLPKLVRNGSSTSNASTDSQLYGKLREYMSENKTLK